jgi:broad specificity phosphatase PhoE
VSTLTLVRHGQAYPFQRKDAALTPAGEAQAVKLAQFWLRNGAQFDEVYSGTLCRQQRTEELAANCFREAGQPWPAATRDPAWNEYDATGALDHLAPADPRLRELAAEFERSRGSANEHRAFHRMLEATMNRWLEAGTAVDGVESWPSFRDRVSGAIERLMTGPAKRRVVVFTSGGPIGFAVHRAMQAPARAFLDVNWRVRNTSITQFIFDQRRFTLDGFNAIPHLDEAVLWTYR